MMKLSDRKWEAFHISDEKENGIFKLRASMSGIDKNKLLDSKEPQIPYITRSDFNNGVSLFVGKEQKEKYQLDNGNVITIGLDTQTVFYQPHSFYTGQNIQVLYNENLNKYTAKFIIPLLKMQVSKLSWGGNGATLGRLKRMQLLLPVNDDNLPDYAFMEAFIKEREAEKRKQYIEYCKKQLKNIGGGHNLIPLKDKEWQSFFIVDIFDNIQRGKRLKTADHLSGKVPYVSSSSLNNGVDNFVSNNKGVRRFSNCISLANSGSVGSSFYEPFEFVASDHITHLKNEEFNKYHYLFLATMTSRLSQKYNFNREINDKRISREIILLPLNDESVPDYEYMEQYSKNLICKKIRNYLDYVLGENHS